MNKKSMDFLEFFFGVELKTLKKTLQTNHIFNAITRLSGESGQRTNDVSFTRSIIVAVIEAAGSARQLVDRSYSRLVAST